MKLSTISILAALIFGSLAVPAAAHHSFAMFDDDNKMAITGVVREFQWVNPHIVIWVDVPTEGREEPVTWASAVAGSAVAPVIRASRRAPEPRTVAGP